MGQGNVEAACGVLRCEVYRKGNLNTVLEIIPVVTFCHDYTP
jgi:hypothetical protein